MMANGISGKFAAWMVGLALLGITALIVLGGLHTLTKPVESVNRTSHGALYVKDNQLYMAPKKGTPLAVARLHEDAGAVSASDVDMVKITANGNKLFYGANEQNGAFTLYTCPTKEIATGQQVVSQEVTAFSIEDFGNFVVFSRGGALFYTDGEKEMEIAPAAAEFAVGGDRKTVVYTVYAEDGTFSLYRWHCSNGELELIDTSITRMACELRMTDNLFICKDGALWVADAKGRKRTLLDGVGAQGSTDRKGEYYYQLEGQGNDTLCRYTVKNNKLDNRKVITTGIHTFSIGSGGVVMEGGNVDTPQLSLYNGKKIYQVSERTASGQYAFWGSDLYFLDWYDGAQGGTLTRFRRGNKKALDTGVVSVDPLATKRIVYLKTNGELYESGTRKTRRIDMGVHAICRPEHLPGV